MFNSSLLCTITNFLFVLNILGVVIENLILYRTCIHALNHPESECKGFLSVDRTNETISLETEVQRLTAFVTTAKSVTEAVVPAFLCMFLGAWSDKHGRKPLIIWPLLGEY